MGHYPYPVDVDGKPIDTPEWRDANNIKKLAHPSDSDLITAIRLDNPAAVDEAIAKGADINQKDKAGFTPLMLAIKAQNSRLIYKLLDVPGVDINCKSHVRAKTRFTTRSIVRPDLLRMLAAWLYTLNDSSMERGHWLCCEID